MSLKTKILIFIVLFGLSTILGVSITFAASVFDLQPAAPAETITYNEPVQVNGNFVVNGIGYFPQGVHIGQQGTGGVTFLNGTIVNFTTGSVGEDLPVTVGDGLRVDGLIWRGPNKGMAIDGMPLKIGDTMVPGLDNINDFGTSKLRWKNGYFAGTLYVGALGGEGVVSGGNIAQNTISTDRLADGAVISAKIADGTITNADLANNAITGSKLIDSYASGSIYDSRFVNVTGDSMSGKLTIAGALGSGQGALEVTNSASSSYGIKGVATGSLGSAGVYGEATNVNGVGIFGYTTNNNSIGGPQNKKILV